MKKIDCLIIGAQKAGTTSLKNYLAQHERINTHFIIEYPFFKDDNEHKRGYEESLVKYYDNILANELLLAKNVGIYYDEKALRRVIEHNPKCKLILSLRDPVSRTISSFNMEKFNGGFSFKFEDIINSIKNKDVENPLYKVFIEQSLYYNHIGKIFKYFPKEQITIIKYEDFILDPETLCNQIFEWLGLKKSIIDIKYIHNQTKSPRSAIFSNLLIKLRGNNSKIKSFVKAILPYRMFSKIGMYLLELNKSKNKKVKQVNSKDIEFLNEYYKPYNEKLNKLIGIDFNSS